jgi:hypothetical protein
VDPDRDPFIDRLRRELRKDPVGGDVDSRIMGAVRRTGMARWPRLFRPRRLFVTPLPWSLGATAALIVAGLLGARLAMRGAVPAEVEGFYDGNMRRVQFVLVQKAASKVSIAGDFNSWDPGHSRFQAHHIGGGVWTVTAPVPVGHHRYSFVVDDTLWVADPNAPRANDDDFGLPKSALVVRAAK